MLRLVRQKECLISLTQAMCHAPDGLYDVVGHAGLWPKLHQDLFTLLCVVCMCGYVCVRLILCWL